MARDLSSGCIKPNFIDDEKEEGEISLEDVSSSEDVHSNEYGSRTLRRCTYSRSMQQCACSCRTSVNANAHSKTDTVQEKENRHQRKDSADSGTKVNASTTLQEKNDDLVPISSDSDMDLVGISDKSKQLLRKPKKKKRKKTRIDTVQSITPSDSHSNVNCGSPVKNNFVKYHRDEQSTSFRSSANVGRSKITKTCVKRHRSPTLRMKSPYRRSRSPIFRSKTSCFKKIVKNEFVKKFRSPKKPPRSSRSILKKSIKNIPLEDVADENVSKLLKKVRRLESTKNNKEQGSSLKEKLSNIIKKDIPSIQNNIETKGNKNVIKSCDGAEDEDDIALLRQMALKTKQGKLQQHQEPSKSMPVTKTVVNDEDEEDLKLRMIALRSAVLKKHQSRVELKVKNEKKKATEIVVRSESPFNFLNDEHLEETNNALSNLDHNPANESRDIIMPEDMELDSDSDTHKEVNNSLNNSIDQSNELFLESEPLKEAVSKRVLLKNLMEISSSHLTNAINTDASSSGIENMDITNKLTHKSENERHYLCKNNSKPNLPYPERPYSPTDITVYDPDLPGLHSTGISFSTGTSVSINSSVKHLMESNNHTSNDLKIQPTINLIHVSKPNVGNANIKEKPPTTSLNCVNDLPVLLERPEAMNEIESSESSPAPEISNRDLEDVDLDGSPLVHIDKDQSLNNVQKMLYSAQQYIPNVPDTTNENNILMSNSRNAVPVPQTNIPLSELSSSISNSEAYKLLESTKLHNMKKSFQDTATSVKFSKNIADNVSLCELATIDEDVKVISPNKCKDSINEMHVQNTINRIKRNAIKINKKIKHRVIAKATSNNTPCKIKRNSPNGEEQKKIDIQNCTEEPNLTEDHGEKHSKITDLEIEKCNLNNNIKLNAYSNFDNTKCNPNETDKYRLSLDEDEDALRQALLASIVKKSKATDNVTSLEKSSKLESVAKLDNTTAQNQTILKTVINEDDAINTSKLRTKLMTNTSLVKKPEPAGSNITTCTTVVKRRPVTSCLIETSPRKMSKKTPIPVSAKAIKNAKRYQILTKQRKLLMQKTAAAEQCILKNIGNRCVNTFYTYDNVCSLTPHTPPHSNKDRLIISLHSDSDSDSEVERHKSSVAVTMNRSSIDKRPLLNVPKTDFEKSVDQLLRELRTKQEMATVEISNLSQQKNQLNKKNSEIVSKETIKSSKLVTESIPKRSQFVVLHPTSNEPLKTSKLSALTSTPLAVRHLPASKQEEYRRLKQVIFEREKQLLGKTNKTLSPRRNENILHAVSNRSSPKIIPITTASKAEDILLKNKTTLVTSVSVPSTPTMTMQLNNTTRSPRTLVNTIPSIESATSIKKSVSSQSNNVPPNTILRKHEKVTRSMNPEKNHDNFDFNCSSHLINPDFENVSKNAKSSDLTKIIIDSDSTKDYIFTDNIKNVRSANNMEVGASAKNKLLHEKLITADSVEDNSSDNTILIRKTVDFITEPNSINIRAKHNFADTAAECSNSDYIKSSEIGEFPVNHKSDGLRDNSSSVISKKHSDSSKSVINSYSVKHLTIKPSTSDDSTDSNISKSVVTTKCQNISSIRILTKEQINRKTIHAQELCGRSVTMDDLIKSLEVLESSDKGVLNSNSNVHTIHDSVKVNNNCKAPNELNLNLKINEYSENKNPLYSKSTSNASLSLNASHSVKPISEEKSRPTKDLDKYKVDVINELESLANLSLDEQKQQLIASEDSLIVKRHCVLDQLDQMSRYLKQWETERYIQGILAVEVKKLREQLVEVEKKLSTQKNKVNDIGPKVSETQQVINRGRRECFRLSKICADLGKRVFGLNYKAPSVCAQRLNKRVKEIAAHSRKLAQKSAVKIDLPNRCRLEDMPTELRQHSKLNQPLLVILEDDTNNRHKNVSNSPCLERSAEFELIDLASQSGQIEPSYIDLTNSTLIRNTSVVPTIEHDISSPQHKMLSSVFVKRKNVDIESNKQIFQKNHKCNKAKMIPKLKERIRNKQLETRRSLKSNNGDDRKKECLISSIDNMNNAAEKMLPGNCTVQINNNLSSSQNAKNCAPPVKLDPKETLTLSHSSVQPELVTVVENISSQINGHESEGETTEKYLSPPCTKGVDLKFNARLMKVSSKIESNENCQTIEKDIILNADTQFATLCEHSQLEVPIKSVDKNPVVGTLNDITDNCKQVSSQEDRLTEVHEHSEPPSLQSRSLTTNCTRSNHTGRSDIRPYESILKHLQIPRNIKTDGILCPYELMGTCNDNGCQFIHQSTRHCR